MSAERKPLGAMNPHPQNYWERNEIWIHALGEFLWPKKSPDSEREKSSSLFIEWQRFLAVRQGLFMVGSNYLDRYPTFDEWCRKMMEERKIAITRTEAERFELLWITNWEGMVSLESSLEDGTVGYEPMNRKASVGLRFCLLVLVLRYGVQDGSPAVNRRLKLVHWKDAKDAAALLLAVCVLSMREPESGFDVILLPWVAVKEAASEMRKQEAVDSSALKYLPENARIESFRHCLRVTLDDTKFLRVSRQALRYEQGLKDLDKWREMEHLKKWFRGGRA